MSDPFVELDKPLPEIKVTCTSTDCDNDQHCFLQKKKVAGTHVFGACRACDAEPRFDLGRVRRCDAGDMGYTFASLRHEKIRAHYWSIPFDEDALRRARKKGRPKVIEAVSRRIKSSIGKKANGFDGRQTALSGNVIFYAQHATATCCRKCLSYWHGIPADRDLDVEESTYCEAMVVGYLDERLPASALASRAP